MLVVETTRTHQWCLQEVGDRVQPTLCGLRPGEVQCELSVIPEWARRDLELWCPVCARRLR